MIDEESLNNRKIFQEKSNTKRLGTLPRKYFDKFIRQGKETKYDHAIMFRGKKYEYMIISPYPGSVEKELIAEGWKKTVPMYNTSCNSYRKTFKYNRGSKVEEV